MDALTNNFPRTRNADRGEHNFSFARVHARKNLSSLPFSLEVATEVCFRLCVKDCSAASLVGSVSHVPPPLPYLGPYSFESALSRARRTGKIIYPTWTPTRSWGLHRFGVWFSFLLMGLPFSSLIHDYCASVHGFSWSFLWFSNLRSASSIPKWPKEWLSVLLFLGFILNSKRHFMQIKTWWPKISRSFFFSFPLYPYRLQLLICDITATDKS